MPNKVVGRHVQSVDHWKKDRVWEEMTMDNRTMRV